MLTVVAGPLKAEPSFV